MKLKAGRFYLREYSEKTMMLELASDRTAIALLNIADLRAIRSLCDRALKRQKKARVK